MRGAILLVLIRLHDGTGGMWIEREYIDHEHYNLTYCYYFRRRLERVWKEDYVKGSCRLETNAEYRRRTE